MAKAIALTSAQVARVRSADMLRSAIVCACGIALVMAGPILPL